VIVYTPGVQIDESLRRHIPGILLLAALLIALAIYLIWPPPRIARTLFFPGNTTSKLTGEQRLVPRTRSRDRALELIVEEVILGPTMIAHGRAVPRETRIQSFVVAGDVVYVDLSPEILFDSDEVRVDTRDGIEAIVRSLRYNFRSIENVQVTINGQVPYEPAYRIAEDVIP
jgi:hypothetical protein